ncbi:hypothetical protein K440DRAFT_660807 [Wilcoxina mikolae CBS 423.85]|nr:hypothetical protein K440DRAFT_660807 [Wilcoxina mikolae CBS 423.85]
MLKKIAAADTRFRMAKALLDEGFPLEVKCHEDHTPLQCAMVRSCPEGRIIQRHICPTDRTLASRVVAELLSRGANANVQNSAGRTPLHQAIAACDVELTSVLLRAGADTPRLSIIKTSRPIMIKKSSG